jgi:hypothetical protein
VVTVAKFVEACAEQRNYVYKNDGRFICISGGTRWSVTVIKSLKQAGKIICVRKRTIC